MLVTAKKTDKGLAIKKQLAAALNDSQVFSGSSDAMAELGDDIDDIPIPKPSFDTGDDAEAKKEETKEADKEEQEEITAEDIKLAILAKSPDGTITGYSEFKDGDKLESIAGFRDGDVLAFVVDPEAEFEIAVMADDPAEEDLM